MAMGITFQPTKGTLRRIAAATLVLFSFAGCLPQAGQKLAKKTPISITPKITNQFSYVFPQMVYTVGQTIPVNAPYTNITGIKQYAVTPSLPTGIQLDSVTGKISGSSSSPLVLSDYIIAATTSTQPISLPAAGTPASSLVNTDTTFYTTVSFAILEVPPASLTYTTTTGDYIVGIAMPENIPTLTGGNATSFSITPALPDGLALNPTTGLINGVPLSISPIANYVVTASNSGGSATTTLSMRVRSSPPTNLTYTFQTVTYSQGALIIPNTPSNSGGIITTYSISPPLPAGLSLDNSTGIITGTPTTLTSSNSYTVTGSNVFGNAYSILHITVSELPPQSLYYTYLDSIYSKGEAIAPNEPTNSGGQISTYTVTPPLPVGLTLNPATGVISGTPTSLSSTTNYSVVGSNGGGSASVLIKITVIDLPPTDVAYTYSSSTYTKGTAIPVNSPTNQGGTVSSYTISPALPPGLSFNSINGKISGTPSVVSPTTTYMVIASNSGGSASVSIGITVNEAPPTSLTYSAPAAVYHNAITVTPNMPSNSGGPISNYSITPNLPAGLTFNTNTGVISGTPTEPTSPAPYTITGINSGGSTSVTIALEVRATPPSSLTYNVSPAVYTKNVLITPNQPSNLGGAITLYSITPSLPTGLILNSSTGRITGTPTVLFPSASFTITGSNTGGMTDAVLDVSVVDVPPSSLTYTSPTPTYVKGSSITQNLPSSSGGPVISYSITPALPAGLDLNSSTGVISGTPTAIAPVSTYTVTATNTGGNATVDINLRVNDIPPASLTYSELSSTYTKGTIISQNLPSNSAGAIVSYSVSPALPAGITLNSSTGVVSGTPTVVSAVASYVVTGTNSGGTTTTSLSITVIDAPPTTLQYASPTGTYTINTPIVPNHPSNEGGTIVSYSISPALPSGLSINSSTGVISGSAPGTSPTTTYTVTGTNTGGSTTSSVTITVDASPPTNLTYSSMSPTYTKGSGIPSNTPSNFGGTIGSYSVSPALPSGLSINSGSGVISGTPNVIITTSAFTVTGSNALGSTTAVLNIRVNDAAPTTLSYASMAPIYTKGVATSNNTPSNLGGVVISYSISPTLPSGLNLNTSTGVISGTPTFMSVSTPYVVTATNSGGSTTATLNITVNDIPPESLSYSSMSETYSVGTAISTNYPTSSGGAVVQYSISPTLPAGLTLNSSTGAISGTPSIAMVATPFVVTASNTGGDTTATLLITVTDAPPHSLNYAVTSPTYSKGIAISNNAPSNSGGVIVSYAISPALPSGLNLNSSTGILSGTSTIISTLKSYTVTGTNSGGSTVTTLNIRVNDIAPSNLTYTATTTTYAKGSPISNNNPSNSGGAIVTYTTSPALPAGLSLNASTGIITGTPTQLSSATNYLITGTNTGGSTAVILNFTVQDLPPGTLTYSSMNPSYTVSTAITPNTPSNSGGPIVSYSVSPGLPSGLSLNTSTGVITGTPTVYAASSAYTITATNTLGSTTATLNIAVNDLPPANLSYSSLAPVYSKGSVITNNTPSQSGGIVLSYSISPALPTGLSLNTSSGVISGTPTAISISTPYVVTATNLSGNATATLNITVNDIPPSSFTYSAMSPAYTKGSAITNNTPTSSGGPVISYSISPSLPTGLSLNSTSGIISGTPTNVTATANYVITATNSGGTANATLNIQVKDIPPTALSYLTTTATYLKGTTITPNTASNTGGTIVSYSISPALPAGLSLNTGTGVISGTSSAIVPAQDYVVTGTNSGGSVTITLNITVNDIAPTFISYPASTFVLPKGFSTSQTPSFTGGTPTSFGISSSLPGGLSLNSSSGVISGTPTVNRNSTVYTISGANATGFANTAISIKVTQTSWMGNIASTPAFGGATGCSTSATGEFSPGYCTGGTAQSGTGDGMMNSPNGIYVDGSSTTLYVADSGNHRINRYSISTGAFTGWIGRVSTMPSGGTTGCGSTPPGQATPGWCTGGTSQSGTGNGMFNTPTGITGDGTYLYIVDQGNDRLMKFVASTGVFVGWAGKVGTVPTGGAAGCTSVSAGSYTNLWCTGGLAAQGLATIDGSLNLPEKITIDSSFNLYVTDKGLHTVNRYASATGAFSGWIGRISNTRPTGGVAGCTSASKNNFSPGWCIGGDSSTGNGDGSFNSPTGITSDSTSLYVTNSGNDQVGKYTTSTGAFVGWIGKVASTPSGGVAGCTGTAVGIKTPGWCTGGSSATLGTGDGMFTLPSGVVVDGTSLYISDTGNNRILKHNASTGAFVGWTGNILTSPTGGEAGCSGGSVNSGTLGWCTGGTSQSGNSDAMFNSPYAITRDSSSRLYISDGGNSRVVRLVP
jgi:hypothetical protein